MVSWIETARAAVNRSQVAREELRKEANSMLANGEFIAAKRIFHDILEEPMPDVELHAGASASQSLGSVDIWENTSRSCESRNPEAFDISNLAGFTPLLPD